MPRGRRLRNDAQAAEEPAPAAHHHHDDDGESKVQEDTVKNVAAIPEELTFEQQEASDPISKEPASPETQRASAVGVEDPVGPMSVGAHETSPVASSSRDERPACTEHTTDPKPTAECGKSERDAMAATSAVLSSEESPARPVCLGLPEQEQTGLDLPSATSPHGHCSAEAQDAEATPLQSAVAAVESVSKNGFSSAEAAQELRNRVDTTPSMHSSLDEEGRGSPVPPSAVVDDDTDEVTLNDDDTIERASIEHDDLLDDDSLPPVVRRKRQKTDAVETKSGSVAEATVTLEDGTGLTEAVSGAAESSPVSFGASIPRRSKGSAFHENVASDQTELAAPAPNQSTSEEESAEPSTGGAQEEASTAHDLQPTPAVPEKSEAEWNKLEDDDSSKLRPALSLKEAAEYIQTLPRRHPEGTNDARLFIGNLASETTSPVELISIFSKYGRIIEQPLLLRSYAFIQYDNPESTQLAIRYEQGRLIGGRHLDLSVASGRRNDSGSGNHGTRRATGREAAAHHSTGPVVEGKRGPLQQSSGWRKRDAAALETGGPRPPPRPGAPYVRILVIGTTSRSMAHAMQNVIRSLGISADVAYIFSDSLGTALKEAYAQCVRYVIVVSSKDASKGTCSIRTYEKTGFEYAGGGSIIPFHEALAIIFREERINLPLPPAAYTVASAAMALSPPTVADPSNISSMMSGVVPGMTPPAPSLPTAAAAYRYQNPMVAAPGTMPYPYASMPPGYLYGHPGAPQPQPQPQPSAPPQATSNGPGSTIGQRAYPGYMASLPPTGMNAPVMHAQHPGFSGNAPYAANQPSTAPPGADMDQVKQLLATLQQFQQRNAAARSNGGHGTQ